MKKPLCFQKFNVFLHLEMTPFHPKQEVLYDFVIYINALAVIIKPFAKNAKRK